MYKPMQAVVIKKFQAEGFVTGADSVRIDNTYLHFMYLQTSEETLKVLVPSFCHKSIIDALKQNKKYKMTIGSYSSNGETRYKFIGIAE